MAALNRRRAAYSVADAENDWPDSVVRTITGAVTADKAKRSP
jgi:hypothetical protein